MPKHGKTTKTSKTKKGRARPGSYRGVQDAGDAYLAPRTDEYDGGVDDFFAGRARKVQVLPRGLGKALTKAGKKLKGAFRFGTHHTPTHLERRIDEYNDAREREEYLAQKHGDASGHAKAARWGSVAAAKGVNTAYKRQLNGLPSGRARPVKLHGHARGQTCPKCRK